MIRIRFDIWSRLFIDSVKEYLSVSKVAMRLKVISYLSFWSRSKNKNMLWPFWSKDWGPEFSIAQPKVTAYLKSNHILSFITCSSDPSPILNLRILTCSIKYAVCFDLLKANFCLYREFSPYANFITAIFITAILITAIFITAIFQKDP